MGPRYYWSRVLRSLCGHLFGPCIPNVVHSISLRRDVEPHGTSSTRGMALDHAFWFDLRPHQHVLVRMVSEGTYVSYTVGPAMFLGVKSLLIGSQALDCPSHRIHPIWICTFRLLCESISSCS